MKYRKFEELRNKPFSERLSEAIAKAGMTNAQLSEKTNISPSSITDWTKGRYKAKQDKIYILADALNVKPSWLMGVGPYAEDGKSIPLIGQIAAGSPILAEENIEDYFVLDKRIRADFCLRVKGDSMIDDNINDGDIVFIKHQSDVENGEIAAVIIDGEATLKRVHKKDGSIILQPSNKKYQPMLLDHGTVIIAGKLTATLSMGK